MKWGGVRHRSRPKKTWSEVVVRDSYYVELLHQVTCKMLWTIRHRETGAQFTKYLTIYRKIIVSLS